MKFELILAVDSGDGQITNVPLAQMTRPDVSELATLRLSLSESKQLLAQLQHEIVTRQFEATTQQRRHCGQCGTKRAIKDFHGARFRSLFGDVELRVPRLRKCQCALDSPVQGSANATLRQRWIAPELECVQSELAAVLPYARSAALLSKLLPIGAGNSASTGAGSYLARRTTPGIGADGCARETARSSHAPASLHDSRPGRWLCSPLRPRCRALLRDHCRTATGRRRRAEQRGLCAHRRSALAYAGTASRCRTGQEQRSPDGLHRWRQPLA